ncbi:aldo/keto reductase [Sphingomonas sp. BGYR3]|uniref:aldo/keto reductase n=1 Tax=Sphingomonas sp. BGYR3 TaxID=2975483 RepID=UPI0021A5DD82|nr:aldo/keto reductase [Sphingomonas sp. BGYR3]MDG5489741.1 aldo/keto reductase [Sphingomonas sp. BGYR3]
MMEARPLGRTGVAVSPIAFGTARWHRGGAGDLSPVLAHAVDRGISAIEMELGDDALNAAIGGVLAGAGRRGRAQLVCRLRPALPIALPSHHLSADQLWPAAGIVDQVDAALLETGVERLAAVHVPEWCAEWLDEGEWAGALTALVDAGKIAGFGVAAFDHDPDAMASAIASGRIQGVQSMLNLFDQRVAAMLPALVQRGLWMVARMPFYAGGLLPGHPAMRGERPFADARDISLYPQHRDECRQRAARIAAAWPAFAADPAGSMIRHQLAMPGISTIAIGLSTCGQVDAAIASAAAGPVAMPPAPLLAEANWLG